MRKVFSTNRLLYLLAAVFFILIILFILLFLNKPLEERLIEIKFSVSEKFGVDLNSSALIFGRVIPGTIISRIVNIENNRDFPIIVRIYVSENLKDYIISENKISLPPRESANLGFTLSVPKGTMIGNYTGYAVIKAYRENFYSRLPW